MLTAIKVYAALALLFPAAWATIGWNLRKRREAIRDEYRWHMSPIYLHEPQEVIRARPEEIILP